MSDKLLRYSVQLAMLKQLLLKKMINKKEYNIYEDKLKKDYNIASNFTA